MTTQWKQTATIHDTYLRSVAENLGITKNYIRNACLNGTLKHCKAGRKTLIFYPNLLEMLKNGDVVEENTKATTQIRKIPEKLPYSGMRGVKP